MSCELKTLRVYRGYPTLFNSHHWLSVSFNSEILITGWGAKFVLDNITKTYQNVQSGFYVDLTAQETAGLKNGLLNGTLILIDTDGHEHPFATDIPVMSSDWVDGEMELDNFDLTVNVEIQENELEIKIKSASPSADWEQKIIDGIANHNSSEDAHPYIQGLIDEEAADREEADGILQDNIEEEEQARISADTTLQTNINNEAAARANADTTLQTNINTEASTRAAADTTLTNNLNTEIATRENADTVLATAISDEATARENADTTLQNNIDAESLARTNADTALGTRIDNLQLNSLTDVNVSGMTNGQALVYDTTAQKWKNGTVALNQGTGISIANNTISVADPTLINNGTGSKSVAVGKESEATQEGTTAVGHDANSTSTFGTAVGYASRATNTNTTAVGKEAKATQARATAIGALAEATATDAIQIGGGTNSTPNTLQVKTYALLNTSTGIIPVDRIPDITLSKVSEVTATASELNVLDGITASTTELNYTDGVTSNIQTQLNNKQATVSDLETIRSNATAGQNASNTIATYGDIVTHNVNEFATADQGALADSALQENDVVNTTSSTSTTSPLSANMGKELQDQIDNLKARGRFLALWNCATGLAMTEPTENPYTYKTGDYFVIGNVATGSANNYRPNGSTYDKDVPSTTIETESVGTDDVYYYDGTRWALQINTQKTITFAQIAGQPTDNTNLASALNAKVTANNAITGATYTKITYDSKGLVTGGSNLAQSDIPSLNLTKISDVTATASEVNVLDGITSTTTELNYVDGVTSPIQTQIDNRVVKNNDITGATKCKITYDEKGLVTAGSDLSASDIPNLSLSKISDVTATASEVNVLDGITATTTELNYVDGVTSNIQTQLNAKANEDDLGTLAYADAITNGDISGTINQDKITNLTTDLGNKVNKNADITASTTKKLVTYDSKGLVTGGSDLAGSDVTGALGYTPYNSTNPNGYQTSSQVSTAISSYHDSTKQDNLPTQSGQSGKYLTTNGSDLSWGAINALQNTATNVNSLTIVGNASTKNLTVNVGVGSRTTSDGGVAVGFYAETVSGVAIGRGSKTSGFFGVAVGNGVETLSNYSATLGSYTTNNGANSFVVNVGGSTKTINEANSMVFCNSTGEYKLIDGNGDIPVGRFGNMVSNCITEIPQDIKLELNNGTLTLKSGSKVYVPNGAGVFNTVNINSDITLSQGWGSSETMMLSVFNGTALGVMSENRCVSGPSDSISGNDHWYYNTTNNTIRFINADGSARSNTVSLPIAKITMVGDGTARVSYINQVFNGFGYIGSTVFELPGVKGLAPNGRNADGTLKSVAFTANNVITFTSSFAHSNAIITDGTGLAAYNNSTITPAAGKVCYVESENKTYAGYETPIYAVVGTLFTNDGSKISGISIQAPFHALEYNDKGVISSWGMPSSGKTLALSLGATGNSYVAPANGFFCLSGWGSSENIYNFVRLYNQTAGFYSICWLSSTNEMSTWIPVKRDDVVQASYNQLNNGSLKFIYAQGETDV